ncbi:Na+/H+ antiporter NhaA [Serratia proteamaculans]
MTNIIRQFLRQEAAGGIILIVAAIIALIMANTRASGDLSRLPQFTGDGKGVLTGDCQAVAVVD